MNETTKDILIVISLIWIATSLSASWRIWKMARKGGTKSRHSFWLAAIFGLGGPITLTLLEQFWPRDTNNPRRRP